MPDRAATSPLTPHERPVLTHEQIEVLALFVGKLEEDLLAFGILEPFAVFLEETVRSPLASNADHQRLLVVDPTHQTFGALGEQTVRRAFEEEERGTGFELRVAHQELPVPAFQLSKVFLLFFGEVLKDLAASRVARQTRSARVELEPASLGGNRDAECIPREQQLGIAVGARRGTTGPALLARPVDLHDALRRREASGAGDFLDKGFDVRAQELGRSIARLADEMKVPGMAIGMLETESPLAEVDLPGNPGVDHPLERSIDGGPADPLIFAANEVNEVIGAEVTLLAHEHIDNLFPLTRPFAAGRLERQKVRKRQGHNRQNAPRRGS